MQFSTQQSTVSTQRISMSPFWLFRLHFEKQLSTATCSFLSGYLCCFCVLWSWKKACKTIWKCGIMKSSNGSDLHGIHPSFTLHRRWFPRLCVPACIMYITTLHKNTLHISQWWNIPATAGSGSLPAPRCSGRVRCCQTNFTIQITTRLKTVRILLQCAGEMSTFFFSHCFYVTG